MSNQEIINYIKNQLLADQGEEEIKLRLEKVGWRSTDIEIALQKAKAEISSETIVDNQSPTETNLEKSDISLSKNKFKKKNKIYLKIILALFILIIIGLSSYFVLIKSKISIPFIKENLSAEQIVERASINLLNSPYLNTTGTIDINIKNQEKNILTNLKLIANQRLEKDSTQIQNMEIDLTALLEINLIQIENSLPKLIEEIWNNYKQNLLINADENPTLIEKLNLSKIINKNKSIIEGRVLMKIIDNDLYLKLNKININENDLLTPLTQENELMEIMSNWLVLTGVNELMDTNTNKTETNEINSSFFEEQLNKIKKSGEIISSRNINKNNKQAISLNYKINDGAIENLIDSEYMLIDDDKEITNLFQKYASKTENELIIDLEDYQILTNISKITINLEDFLRENLMDELNLFSSTNKDKLIEILKEIIDGESLENTPELTEKDLLKTIDELEKLIKGLEIEIIFTFNNKPTISPFYFEKPIKATNIFEFLFSNLNVMDDEDFDDIEINNKDSNDSETSDEYFELNDDSDPEDWF